MFTDAASVTDCLEILKRIARTAVEPGCSPWVSVDCFDRDAFLKQLVTSYKKNCAGVAVDEGGLDVSSLDAMCVQNVVTA